MTTVEAVRYTLERILDDKSLAESCNTRHNAATIIARLATQVCGLLDDVRHTGHSHPAARALVRLAAAALLSAGLYGIGPHGDWKRDEV